MSKHGWLGCKNKNPLPLKQQAEPGGDNAREEGAGDQEGSGSGAAAESVLTSQVPRKQ